MLCFLFHLVNRDQSLLLGTDTGTGIAHTHQAQTHTTDRLQRDGRSREGCGELKFQIALGQTNLSGYSFVFIPLCEITTY